MKRIQLQTVAQNYKLFCFLFIEKYVRNILQCFPFVLIIFTNTDAIGSKYSHIFIVQYFFNGVKLYHGILLQLDLHVLAFFCKLLYLFIM